MRYAPAMVALLALVSCSSSRGERPVPTANTPAGQPQIGSFGLDLTAHDSTVKPGDDFYRYADGHWLDSTQIPADRTNWGTFMQLSDEADDKLRRIVEALPVDAPQGSNARKIGDFYRAYLDTDTIERLGLAPAQAGLDAIAAARTHEDVARLIGRPDLRLKSPLSVSISTDQKNPDRYIVSITESGLGMPDRDYYLKSDAQFAQLRAQYTAHIERMLTLAGEQKPQAQAQSILALETEIARLHWPAAKRRERSLTYNPRTRAQLDEAVPGFPWSERLESEGLAQQQDFVLRELDALAALGQLFRQTPVESWRSYLTYHYLERAADILPKAFDDERFDFYGRTLNGQPQQLERWKRAIQVLNGSLGEALGQLYVAQYFPPDSKRKMLALVENLRAAYGERIQHLTWMSPDTKRVALEKLAAFRPKIGYPDKWRDYSALEIRAGDAFGNSVRASVVEWHRVVARINLPTDRDEWGMTPQTVNAYYNPTFNEVVFPAAILQPPFFDPNADPAVNYGGIGGVIGHEMSHGFDDQGSKSDAHGVLRTWWQPEDEVAFKSLVDRLAGQYDTYSPLPGLHLNGRLTLGENIGDLGGLSVTFEAYHLSLQGKKAPLLGGLTGEQRLFLSWAQVWRSLYRDEQLRTLVLTNPHSPGKFRVNGVVRNLDAWYQAFDVKPGDQLYLAPEERIHVW